MINTGFGSSFAFGRRTGGVPVTATSIQIWYDATDSTTFQPNASNGTAISQWNDKSSIAHNANPTGGNAGKPTIVTNSLNGQRTLSFDGVSNNLQVTNMTFMASISKFTLLIVAKLTSTTGTRVLSCSDQDGFKVYYDGTHWAIKTASGIGTSTNTGDTTNFHIFTLAYDGTAIGNANRLRLRIDQVPQTLNFGATTVGTSTSASTSKMNFAWDGVGNYLAGNIAEIHMYTSALSNLAISTDETYLKNKWGL